MKIAYVAGSYRADTVNGIHDNIERARAVAVELWRMGYAVICPHLNSAMMDGVVPDHRFIDGDIEIVRRAADCIIMLPGWEYSDGSVRECGWAQKFHIKVFQYQYDLEEIEKFVEA